MFTKSAKIYDVLYHFKDYESASSQLAVLIERHNPAARSMLDVGCGTGQHLANMRDKLEVEGLDINSDMLAVAAERCPGIVLHHGDMVDFSLGRKFDVVTNLFSSIAYVKTVDRLEKAVACMANHLNDGGLIVVEPWISEEQYWKGRITANFVDEPELKIAWMYTSEIDGLVSVFDINYMIGTPEGVNYFTEKHEMGLFTQDEYTNAFSRAGLEVRYDPDGFFGRGMYIATK